MSYSKQILSAADSALAARRAQALNINSARRAEIAKKVPEITAYEAQLADTGLAAAKAFAAGDDADKYFERLSSENLRLQELIKDALVKAGYPADYLDIPYTCKICSDTGFFEGKVCSCRKQLLKELNIAALHAVSPAARCRFDNFDLSYYPGEVIPALGFSPRERMSDIYEYCKSYAEDFDEDSGSIYMHGPTGLGKTHLSLAIANVAAQKGYNVYYGSAQSIFSELEREKFSYSGSSAASDRILGCDLLIIDDLGSEFVTQFTVAALYDIINTRINLSKPVILSTNLTDAELEAKYTQRFTSRIIGSYESLIFFGNDIRQIKGNGD